MLNETIEIQKLGKGKTKGFCGPFFETDSTAHQPKPKRCHATYVNPLIHLPVTIHPEYYEYVESIWYLRPNKIFKTSPSHVH